MFDAFEEEPKLTVNSSTKKTEERRVESDASIAFDPEYIKQARPQDKSVEQRPHADISALSGPYFYKLPRELRDPVFSQLLASGNPAFMRTSSASEWEGKILIAKHGVCRLNLGHKNRTNCQPPSQEILAGIQNLDIRVNHTISHTSTVKDYPEIKLLDLFAGQTPHRKTCMVSVDDRSDGCQMMPCVVFRYLEALRGVRKDGLADGYELEDCHLNFLRRALD